MRKTILSVLTAVAVVCMVVLGVSLNAASILDNGKKEVKSEKVAVAEAWYFITPGTTPSTQTISGDAIDTLDPNDDCQEYNTGAICAIRLSFPSTAPDLPGITVQEAIDLHDATIVMNGLNPLYAKKL